MRAKKPFFWGPVLALVLLSSSVAFASPQEEYCLIWTYEARDRFNSAEISANGSYVVAGTEYGDRTVYAWKPEHEHPSWRWGIERFKDIRVNDVSISSDGGYFVVGTRYRVHLFENRGVEPVYSENLMVDEAASDIAAVAISPDGSYFAAASCDGYIYLFKNEGAASFVVWSSRQADFWEVRSLDISENGLALVAACGKEVYYFSLAENRPQWTRTTGRYVCSVSISRDGTRVAAGGQDMNVYLFDQNGDELISRSVGDVVWSVSVSPDGSLVAAGSNNGWVSLFDATGAEIWRWENPSNIKPIMCVSISENKSHVVAGADDDHVYLFRIDEGTPIWSYKTKEMLGSVEIVSVSADGHYLIAAPRRGDDCTLYLMARGKPPWVPFFEKIPLWALVAAIVAALGVVGFLIKRRITPKVE